MPTFNFRMQMVPVEIEVEAKRPFWAYELAFRQFQKLMRNRGVESADSLDERAGFNATLLSQLDPLVRDYYCDECGPVEVERPDGDWAEVPCCTDCGQKMGLVPPEVSF